MRPHQFSDQDQQLSGFYTVTDTPYPLTDAQSIVFDADEETAILIVSDAGCDYEIGTNPTGAGAMHRAPAGAFPIVVKANERVYIGGTATISVIE